MAGESEAFELVCEIIADKTSLTGPQVRGSVRLALKEGGLRAKVVTSRQLLAVVDRLMPDRLVAQGVERDQAIRVCKSVIVRLSKLNDKAREVGPGEMLGRLDRARQDR